MWTREMLIVAGCLVSSTVFAAGGYSGGEVVPAPAGYSQASAPMPCNTGCAPACETTIGPPVQPWYYWWTSWHWFDPCTDREQHRAYLPPLPGWYYFRPYSVGQLRAQQEAVISWGGDPRNPYATGTLPQGAAPVAPAAPAVPAAPAAPAAPATPSASARVSPAPASVAPTANTATAAPVSTATAAPVVVPAAPVAPAAPAAAEPRLSAQNEIGSAMIESLPAVTSAPSKAADTLSRTNLAPTRPIERPSRAVETLTTAPANSSRSMDVQLAALIAAPEAGGKGEKREAKSIPVVVPASEAAPSVIPWPPALRHGRFAAERKKIEAPYVRNLGGGPAPTAADFRNMIDAAEQMKAELWKMNVDLSVEETATADKFLDQLVTEARGQIGATPGSSKAAAGATGEQSRLVFGP